MKWVWRCVTPHFFGVLVKGTVRWAGLTHKKEGQAGMALDAITVCSNSVFSSHMHDKRSLLRLVEGFSDG